MKYDKTIFARLLRFFGLIVALAAPLGAQQAPVLADQSTGALKRPTNFFSGNATGNFVSSVAGTANQISASGSTGAVTFSLPSAITAPGTFTATTSISTPALTVSGLTTANGLVQTSGAGLLSSSLTPSGLTSLGVNGISSATGTNLTLGTTSFGTALTFTSATGAALFAANLSTNGNLIVAGTGTSTFAGPVTITPPGTGALQVIAGANSNDGYIKLGNTVNAAFIQNTPSSSGRLEFSVPTGAGFNFLINSVGKVAINSSGDTSIASNTASSSTTTGSLVTAGGLGVTGAGYFGGSISVTNNITSATGNLQLSAPPGAYGVTIAGSSNPISANGSNYSWLLSANGLTHSITAGKTDSGYRGGFRVDTFANEAAFAGTLATQFGLYSRNGINNATSGAVITNSYAYYAEPQMAVAGTTVSNLYGYYLNTGSLGAGTVTNLYGLYVGNVSFGGTLNYAIYTNAGLVRFGDNVSSTGSVLSASATGGLGYATGAGGTVTQGTNRTTGVTINKIVGAITLVSAAGSTSWQTFTVTNSAVAATDVVIVNQKSGTDLYEIHVTAVAAGSFNISFKTTGGTTTEQPVFNFAVIKGVTS